MFASARLLVSTLVHVSNITTEIRSARLLRVKGRNVTHVLTPPGHIYLVYSRYANLAMLWPGPGAMDLYEPG